MVDGVRVGGVPIGGVAVGGVPMPVGGRKAGADLSGRSRSVNLALLLGNAGSDPEVRTTVGGARFAQISLATGRRWRDADGRERATTDWHRVIAWDGLADRIGREVRKGDRLYVEGRVEYRSWQDRSAGERHVTEIIAEEFIMLGGRDRGHGSERASPF